MGIPNNKLLLAATVVLVVSAMCLEGLLGTSLSLNAARRGDSDTFDVSATFTAVDAEGNSMAGASVYCSSDGGSSSLKGTTNSEGTLSFSDSVVLSSGDCPRKSVTRSCYAQKGDAKTETVSDTVELECRSPTSTSTPVEGDRADFDALSGVPGTMCTGETRTVSVSAKNVGTTTWIPTSYRLASTTSQDWGVFAQSLSPAYTISPGEKYKTSFQITAPSTPGTYGFQWEMKNGAGNFFGKPSDFVNIVVSACTPAPTSTPGVSTSCDTSCRSSLGANGGVCATDVSGPKCYEDIEAPVRSKMPTGSNEQVVSWLPSSQSSGFYCEGDSTIKCFCYKLQDCGSDGCMSGKCVAPSGTPTPTPTPTPTSTSCSSDGGTCRYWTGFYCYSGESDIGKKDCGSGQTCCK